MRKIKNSKGFTLMEMLIVVAIIAILVAIAIPTFTSQLEKAREATDAANLRSAYAQLSANYLVEGNTDPMFVERSQKNANWGDAEEITIGDKEVKVDIAKKGWKVSIDANGSVSFDPADSKD